MSNSKLFALGSIIYVAPHMSQTAGMVCFAISLVLSFVFQWREGK